MPLTTPLSPFLAADGSAGIVYMPTECTVAQAAEFLRMSERRLNDLLDAGRIAFRQENDVRLVQWNNLLEYKQRRTRRRAWLEEMVRMNQEMGFYDD